MDVILNLFGEVVIDNQLNIGNVQPSTRYIRRHQNLDFACTELCQCLISMNLNLITVYACTSFALTNKILTDALAIYLTLDED